jgi:hypothetical protein
MTYLTGRLGIEAKKSGCDVGPKALTRLPNFSRPTEVNTLRSGDLLKILSRMSSH